MKKILIIASLCSIGFTACKKDKDDISQVRVVSQPTISFSGSQYFSIRPGETVPTVTATAYDSFLNESYPVDIVGAETVDNTTPGLYVITAQSTNKYGYLSSQSIYIAVTNVPETTNLAGRYQRTGLASPVFVNVTRRARGLYETDDVGGAPTLRIPALFAHLNDTTIDLPLQPTPAGALDAINEKLKMAPGDTTFSYVVVNSSFGTAVRTFKKQ